MSVCTDVNAELLNECFELGPFHGLHKPHPEDEVEPPRSPSPSFHTTPKLGTLQTIPQYNFVFCNFPSYFCILMRELFDAFMQHYVIKFLNGNTVTTKGIGIFRTRTAFIRQIR